MDLDPGILCFVHCSKRVFCLDIPSKCPLCGNQLDKHTLPFRVPYPFVRAAQHRSAVLIKATNGTFLRDYSDSDNLHIGATSSRGILYEFDERGLTIGRGDKSWDQSLIVFQAPEPHWDEALQQVAAQPLWISSQYNENSLNCFDFILTFLQTWDNGNSQTLTESKEAFIANHVLPVIGNAMKYVALYREIISQRFHCSE